MTTVGVCRVKQPPVRLVCEPSIFAYPFSPSLPRLPSITSLYHLTHPGPCAPRSAKAWVGNIQTAEACTLRVSSPPSLPRAPRNRAKTPPTAPQGAQGHGVTFARHSTRKCLTICPLPFPVFWYMLYDRRVTACTSTRTAIAMRASGRTTAWKGTTSKDEGYYSNDKRNGFGTYYWANG